MLSTNPQGREDCWRISESRTDNCSPRKKETPLSTASSFDPVLSEPRSFSMSSSLCCASICQIQEYRRSSVRYRQDTKSSCLESLDQTRIQLVAQGTRKGARTNAPTVPLRRLESYGLVSFEERDHEERKSDPEGQIQLSHDEG
jgi:hypothetical protein